MKLRVPFLNSDVDVRRGPLPPGRDTYELTDLGKEKAENHEAQGPDLRVLMSLLTGPKSVRELSQQLRMDMDQADAILRDCSALQWVRKRGGGW